MSQPKEKIVFCIYLFQTLISYSFLLGVKLIIRIGVLKISLYTMQNDLKLSM